MYSGVQVQTEDARLSYIYDHLIRPRGVCLLVAHPLLFHQPARVLPAHQTAVACPNLPVLPIAPVCIVLHEQYFEGNEMVIP